MSRHEKRYTRVPTADGHKNVELDDHEAEDCEKTVEAAWNKERGAEVVFEDKAACSTSVGYSRAYATGYEATFGKKGAAN